MRIAFINPPALADGRFIEAEDCCNTVTTVRVLPAMLLACASEAKRAGHDVAFVDLSITSPKTLRQFRPELAVYALEWLSHAETHRTLARLCGSVPQIVLAVPPGYVNDYAQLTPLPFCVIYSEPERVVAGLPQDAADLRGWRENAGGIAWYDELDVVNYPAGIVYHSDYLPTCLHELGPVDYSLVPARYWQHYGVAIYQATRGCPYRCVFCGWGGSTVTDRTFRMRPAAQVAGDLRWMKEAAIAAGAKPPPLYVLSAQLTTNLRWLKRFAAAMEDVDYPFVSNINLREVTDEKLELLRGAGMHSMSAGLEATSDELLAMLGKPYTFAQAMAGIRVVAQSGMPCKLHLRSGFGETAAQVAASVAGLREIAALGAKNLSMNLGPLIHNKGTVFRRDAAYRLEPHPDYLSGHWGRAYCPWWPDAPHEAWTEYACEMTRLGLAARGNLRGYPASFREAFARRMRGGG